MDRVDEFLDGAIKVTPAGRRDVPAIAAVMDELDRFYGDTPSAPSVERTARIETLLFGSRPAAWVLLARATGSLDTGSLDTEAGDTGSGDRVVGMAAYSFLWPAVGVTQSLYVKELYVVEAFRRRGVGRLLLREVQRIAAGEGCSRIEWTADRDNDVARGFYERLGFEAVESKLFYRVARGDVVSS